MAGADERPVSVDAWYKTLIEAERTNEGSTRELRSVNAPRGMIIAARANDGTLHGGVAAYTPGRGPGDYQFSLPFNTPAFDFFGTGGFADASGGELL